MENNTYNEQGAGDTTSPQRSEANIETIVIIAYFGSMWVAAFLYDCYLRSGPLCKVLAVPYFLCLLFCLYNKPMSSHSSLLILLNCFIIMNEKRVLNVDFIYHTTRPIKQTFCYILLAPITFPLNLIIWLWSILAYTFYSLICFCFRSQDMQYIDYGEDGPLKIWKIYPFCCYFSFSYFLYKYCKPNIKG